MPPINVTRTHLELRSPAALNPQRLNDPRVTFGREEPCSVETSRALYAAVGAVYHWHDRDTWTDAELAAYLAQPGLFVWILRVDDEIAGYVEYFKHADGSVEIVLFGLMRAFHGRELGAHMLTEAVEEGWRMGASRVHLHTCTLDHPAALPNYLSRGFVPVRTEQYQATVGDT